MLGTSLSAISDAPAPDPPWYERRKSLLRSWIMFSVCLSTTHGCATACIALATATLGDLLGGWSTGLLFFTYTLSSLTIATQLTARFGLKCSIVSSLMLLCTYIAGFLLAAIYEDAAWPAAIVGGAVGGFAAGWLWTAQGLYFARMTKQAEMSPDVHPGVEAGVKESDASIPRGTHGAERGDVESWGHARASSVLSGYFGCIYLSLEVLMKLSSSLLFRYGGMVVTFSVFMIVAITGTLLIAHLPVPPLQRHGDEGSDKKTFAELEQKLNEAQHDPCHSLGESTVGTESTAAHNAEKEGACAQLFSTVNMILSNPVIRYLGVFQMGFGFTNTFGDMYLNGTIVKKSLGVENVGWMAAITPSVAAIIAPILSHLGTSLGGKRSGLLIGCVFFEIVGLVAIIFSSEKLRSLKWGISSVYICMGICRGAFDVSGRAAIVDFLPGENATPGFSSMLVFSGGAFSLAFISYAYMKQREMGFLITGLGALAIVSVIRAFSLHQNSSQRTPLFHTGDYKYKEVKQANPAIQEDSQSTAATDRVSEPVLSEITDGEKASGGANEIEEDGRIAFISRANSVKPKREVQPVATLPSHEVPRGSVGSKDEKKYRRGTIDVSRQRSERDASIATRKQEPHSTVKQRRPTIMTDNHKMGGKEPPS